MTPEEKKIEDSARDYVWRFDCATKNEIQSFEDGAKSEAAKEYWMSKLEPIFRECWIESFFTKRNTDITGFNEWFEKVKKK